MQLEHHGATGIRVYSASGQFRVCGELLGSGGQGAVYGVAGEPDLAVKIYHPRVLAQQGGILQRRIATQCAIRELKTAPGLLWPVMPVFTARKEWLGFVMRRAEGTALSRLAHPALYRKYFPGITRTEITGMLLQLLGQVDMLHQRGIILGDINLTNILYSAAEKKVYLPDTDSYQITSADETFFCPVSRPEFTPPELQGKNLAATQRSAASDLFGLAILIFQCFMLGRHPYDSIGGGSPVENIARGHFPYGKQGLGFGKAGSLPRGPWYIIWSHLSYDLKDCFYTTFTSGCRNASERAAIAQWQTLLQDYLRMLQQGWLCNELRPAAAKSGERKTKSTL